jgi:hypothetical protein
MELTPHLGIGDLLLIKMKEISNDLKIGQMNINLGLIKTHSGNANVRFNFTLSLIQVLFPNCHINIIEEPHSSCDFYNFMNSYSLNQIYIYNNIGMNNVNIDEKHNDCIIFHTKCRHDGLIDQFIHQSLPSLNDFLANFKTTKTILILGERVIGKNYETLTHKTFSLYDNLLTLKGNNNVIDLTHDCELIDGNENFNNFLYDIELINKAACNVTFGIGGPYCMSLALSERNVSFVPFYKSSCYIKEINDIMKITNSLTETVDELNARIEGLCSNSNINIKTHSNV